MMFTIIVQAIGIVALFFWNSVLRSRLEDLRDEHDRSIQLNVDRHQEILRLDRRIEELKKAGADVALLAIDRFGEEVK